MGLYADELAAKTMSDEEGQYEARSSAGRREFRSRSPGAPRGRYRSMSRSRSRSPGENNSTVFVGNLNHDTDDRALREFFTTWGKVLETKIIYNIETGRPRGFGFVKFEDPRDADDAIHHADGKVLDGRTLKCNIAKYPRSGGPGNFRGRGRGPPPGSFRGGMMGGRGDMRGPPHPRRSRSRSPGRYTPGRYTDDRWEGSMSSGSRSPPPKRSRNPSGDIRRPPPRRGPPRHGAPAPSGSFTGSDYSGSGSFSTTDSAGSRSPRGPRPPPPGAAPPPAAMPVPMAAASQPPPPAAFKKELMQAKKREGELATRVSAMEAEMQSAQAVAAQSTAVVDDLRSQLTAVEKTSGKYREWLVALAVCSRAVLAARTDEAAAKERSLAAETDLQLFLTEADDVLGTAAAPQGQSRSHRGHRRRRERAAGEETQAVNGEVAAVAAGEAAAAPKEEGGWAGQGGEQEQDANASAQFKPGIKFKLAT